MTSIDENPDTPVSDMGETVESDSGGLDSQSYVT